MAPGHDVFAGRRPAPASSIQAPTLAERAPTHACAPAQIGAPVARPFTWAAMPLGPATSPDRLRELSRTACLALRERVAAHPATPPDALAQLGLEPAASVRLLVARHPRTPTITRLALSVDEHVAVRRAARPLRRRRDVLAA